MKKQYELAKKGKIKPFMGAVCSFTRKSFEAINGYPNNYYGWGGEDDDLLLRCYQASYHIAYPKNGKVIDLEQISDKTIDSKEKNQYLKENKLGDMTRYEKILLTKDNSTENGLSNLSNLFKVIKTENNVEGFSNCIQYTVNLQKKRDGIISTVVSFRRQGSRRKEKGFV